MIQREPTVAAITGASSGLGSEMARQLARKGWRVGLTARRLVELEALAGAIREEGHQASAVASDAADPLSTRQALNRIAEELGPIDLLIANAGVSLPLTATTFSVANFDQMVRVNLLGPAHAIEAVLPSMLERGRGQIVGISSLAAYRGVPSSSGYSATKAGLTALLEALRPELKRQGVSVTVVHPGYIRTPMTSNYPRRMPFLMDAEPAVRIILKGVAAEHRRVDFPWPMAAALSIFRVLPGALYDRMASRLMLGKTP